MEVEFSTLMAEFKSGILNVTEVGPDFPKALWKEGLVSRLNRLAEYGWKAISVSVEENIFIVDIERREILPSKVTLYSILSYQSTKQKSEYLFSEGDEQNFLKCVQVWKSQGWNVLKIVSMVTPEHEEWILSLLMNEWEKPDHSNRHT